MTSLERDIADDVIWFDKMEEAWIYLEYMMRNDIDEAWSESE